MCKIIKQDASNESSLVNKHCNYLQSQLKWKAYTKVIKMPSWMAWVQRPSGLIKVEGSASDF